MMYAVGSSKSACTGHRALQTPDHSCVPVPKCSCEQTDPTYKQRQEHKAARKKKNGEEINALEEEKAKVVKGRGKHILQLHLQ